MLLHWGNWSTGCSATHPIISALEPGCYLTAEAGVLLTKVIATKPAEGKVFTIVDGAMNDLIRPTLYEAFHRIEWSVKPGAKAVMTILSGSSARPGTTLVLAA